MSATQLQLRRGDSATINASVPAIGEPWVMLDRDNLMVIGDGSEFGGLSANPLPINYISGLIQNDSAVPETIIQMTPGKFRATGDSGDIRDPIGIKKDISAVWTEGTGLGGFPSGLTGGNPSPNATYHVFSLGKIRNGTGDIDAGFDSDLAAVNLRNDASAYSYYRRRGSILTDGSSQIRKFSQRGNVFLTDPVEVINTTSPPATLTTLSFVGVVPQGIKVRPLMTVEWQNQIGGQGAATVYFREKDQSTLEHKLFNFRLQDAHEAMLPVDWVRTDTNAEVDYRVEIIFAAAYFRIFCHGWIDDELGVFQ